MSRVKVHPPSRALRHACACFGIDPDRRHIRRGHAARRAAARALADQLLAALRHERAVGAGGVAFVTGPSGCGKSTLLGALAMRLRAEAVVTVRQRTPSRDAMNSMLDTIVHAAGGSLEDALGVLARAGLAEAPLLAHRAHELSEGQRWRLKLAHAMARVMGQHIDEAPEGRGSVAPGETRGTGSPSVDGAPEGGEGTDQPSAPSPLRGSEDRSGPHTPGCARGNKPAPLRGCENKGTPLSPGCARGNKPAPLRGCEGRDRFSIPGCDRGNTPAPLRGSTRDHAPTLLIDEFASTLDRVTARNLARTVRRWAERAGVRIIAAAANDDVLEALAPDVLVAMTSRGTGTVTTKEAVDARTPS